MHEIIKDIQEKLRNNCYLNEEHVRLSLVARILQALGWDIWNPTETNSEFIVVPSEDRTRVDIALFDTPLTPCVFIEIKAVGKLNENLEQTELQLRDYNRNLTALFCVITDGNIWRFYYPQTGGEFSQKCFRTINILEDEIDDIELNFDAFLSKSEIISGQAKHEAENYLRLNQKQRLMRKLLTKARQKIDSPPFPRFPEALIKLMEQSGFKITKEEAINFIEDSHRRDESARTVLTNKEYKKSNITKIPPKAISASEFYLSMPRNNVDAIGKFTATEFLVFAESKFSIQEYQSITKRNKELRRKLISNGVLVDKNSYLLLAKDHIFRSYSEAAGVIVGYSINARNAWKDQNGKTLNQLNL